MASAKKRRKVVKMKRKQSFFTGALLILFSLYILALTIQSFTRDHISIYEVTEKKIADDNTVRGVILREEKLVNSGQAGYVNYYIGDGSKVGKKTTVYSVDQTGAVYDQLAAAEADELTLTKQNTNEIRSEISAFRDAYNLSHFEETYNFKYSLDNTISELANERMLDNLTTLLKDGNMDDTSFQVVKAGESGIISYTSDGMEDLDLNGVTAKTFDNTTDTLTQLRQTQAIDAGSPVYRLVTSEQWSVIAPLSVEQFKNIQQQDKCMVTLKKIDARVSPDITTFTMDGGYYAKMDLKKYMIQYINNRYIDLEIEINNDTGLKIPKTAKVKKAFYKVDSRYVTKTREGTEGLVVVEYKEDGSASFRVQEADLFSYRSNEEKESEKDQEDTTTYCYVDAGQFEPGTEIALDNAGTDTFTLAETVELDGVYCCNKGYCEFRPIEITYVNNEYCIIRSDTDSGLSAYDHIILNADYINEDDIIY